MSLGWPERGSKCRPVILSEAKDLVAHRTSRPFASLRVTEGHPLPAVSNSAGERKKGGYSFLMQQKDRSAKLRRYFPRYLYRRPASRPGERPSSGEQLFPHEL